MLIHRVLVFEMIFIYKGGNEYGNSKGTCMEDSRSAGIVVQSESRSEWIRDNTVGYENGLLIADQEVSDIAKLNANSNWICRIWRSIANLRPSKIN